MGELEGALARLEWDGMPRKALQSRACGPRSGGFWAGNRPKATALAQAFQSLRASAAADALFDAKGSEAGEFS